MKNKAAIDIRNSFWTIHGILKQIRTLLVFGIFCFSGGEMDAAAQEANIDLNVSNARITEVFQRLREMTSYEFVYSEDDLTDLDKLSLNFENATVADVLDQCFKGTNMSYIINNNVIIIRSSEAGLNVQAQKEDKRQIKGTVVDADTNEPLVGVNVFFKDLSAGTITDVDGKYVLTTTATSKRIVYSYIGYELQEYDLENKVEFDIKLVPQVNQLDEIVATGMQKREKQHNIGAVSQVSSQDMESVGVTSIDKAIAGKVSGVYIRSVSGQPGTVGTIQIRGINTMTGDVEPLYVLDGMPLQSGEISGGVNALITNGIGNIPPEDIKSITILKDATAASIYGARAANGVIVIETKVGESGKDYINYSGKFGVSFKPVNKFDFMDSDQKIDFENQINDEFVPQFGGRVVNLRNQLDNGVITQADYQAEIARLQGINTNWLDILYSNAFSQSHNVSMSGGTNKLQYHASANYQKSDGTLIGNTFQQGGFNMKLSRYLNENVLIKMNLYSTLKKNVEGNASRRIDPFEYAVFANTYEQPYNADGSYAEDASYNSNLVNLSANTLDLNYNGFNILRELKDNTLTNMYSNVRGQLSIEWKFLKDFRFIGTGLVDYTSVHDMDEVRPGTYKGWVENWLNDIVGPQARILPEYNLGSIKESMGRTFNYSLRNSLEYNKKIDKHLVQVFAANEISARTNYRFGNYMPIYEADYRMAGYPNWADLSAGDYDQLKLSRLGSTSFNEDRQVSFIGSAMYSYDNRYVLNGNWRMDGVDIIGTDNQFTPLWSCGIKWNAQNESFFENFSHVISRLALSIGYGYAGSINRSVYPFDVYTLSSDRYDGSVYAQTFTWGNPVLKWEKKEDMDIGLELSLFKGRINFEGHYFLSKITDLLDAKKLPASVGRTEAVVNAGTLTNTGWEGSFRFEVIKKSDWLVEVGANITQVKNELVDVFGKLPPNLPTYTPENIQGYPINSWYGYKFSRVNPDNGHAMVWAQREVSELVNGNRVSNFVDEEIDLTGMNYDDLITYYRPYYLGQNDPKFYGGLNARIVFKNFDFSTNFVYATGNKLISFQDRREGPNDQGTSDVRASRTNRTVNNLNRWRQSGDITNIPVYSSSYTNYQQFLLDTDIEDGSYLKCAQMAVGWRAKSSWLKDSFIQTLRAQVVASNLFTISPYGGTDPETRTPFGYPTTPNVTLSLSIGF